MPAKSYTQPFEVTPTGCWIWKGPRTPYGSPLASVKGKTVLVSYAQFEAKFGYRPKRLGHICPNGKNCINPEHMFDLFRSKKAHQAQKEMLELEPKIEFLESVIKTLESEPLDTETQSALNAYKEDYHALLDRHAELKKLTKEPQPKGDKNNDTGTSTPV